MFEPESPDTKIYSVSELTREIKVLLETMIPTAWLEGEISNFKLHSSGHMYFSMKDAASQIPCVVWRSRGEGFPFRIEDGMKVIALGRVTVYEKRGSYQFDIIKIHPSGIGDLQLALEQLKQRLKEEGLFDEEHKKSLPPYPSSIGIVTSPTGAAIQDLVHILSRRFPGVEIILNPVRVQGEGAAEEIARAIDEFNEFGKTDVLIVGRGGGSLEDLWAFNEEIVARAIYRSTIPVVSAVGHEIDFSISDFVADLRAPTPSAAAERVVPDRRELGDKIIFMLRKIHSHVSAQIEFNEQRLKNLVRSYGFRRPPDMIRQSQQRLDELMRSLERSQLHRQELMRKRLDSLVQKLNALAPTSILRRGYSICYRVEDDKVVKRSDQLTERDKIRVRFHMGSIMGTVDEVEDQPGGMRDDSKEF